MNSFDVLFDFLERYDSCALDYGDLHDEHAEMRHTPAHDEL